MLSGCSLKTTTGTMPVETNQKLIEKNIEFKKEELKTDKIAKPKDAPFYLVNFNTNDTGFALEDNTINKGGVKLEEKDGRKVLTLENKGAVEESWKLQLKKTGIPFESGKKYKGKIWIKGETSGVIFVSIEKGIDPWNSLGLWKELKIETEWTGYDLSFFFLSEDNPENIKFSIQFGVYLGKFWIDGLLFE